MSAPVQARRAPEGAAARPASPAEQVAAAWFATQAVLGVVLWVGIFSSSTVRGWFELVEGRPEVTDAYAVADAVVVAASALTAWAYVRGRSWATLAAGCTLGGVAYPTAYLLAWVRFSGGQNMVALGVMVTTTTLSALAIALARRGSRTTGAAGRPSERGSRT